MPASVTDGSPSSSTRSAFSSSWARSGAAGERHELLQGDHPLALAQEGDDPDALPLLPAPVGVLLAEHEGEHGAVQGAAGGAGRPAGGTGPGGGGPGVAARVAAGRGVEHPHEEEHPQEAGGQVPAAETAAHAAAAGASPVVASPPGSGGGDGDENRRQQDQGEQDGVADQHQHDPDLEQQRQHPPRAPQEARRGAPQGGPEPAGAAVHAVREVVEQLAGLGHPQVPPVLVQHGAERGLHLHPGQPGGGHQVGDRGSVAPALQRLDQPGADPALGEIVEGSGCGQSRPACSYTTVLPGRPGSKRRAAAGAGVERSAAGGRAAAGRSVAAGLRASSKQATMFSGGTFHWTLCTVAKTNPPPGFRSFTRRRTSARTSEAVPNGSVCCESTPPPRR